MALNYGTDFTAGVNGAINMSTINTTTPNIVYSNSVGGVSQSIAVPPPAANSFWNGLAQGAQAIGGAVTSVYSAIAPKTTFVTTSSGSANPIPTGNGLATQAAPSVNIAVPANGSLSQGAQTLGISNNTLLIAGGAILLILIVVMMRK